MLDYKNCYKQKATHILIKNYFARLRIFFLAILIIVIIIIITVDFIDIYKHKLYNAECR